MGQDLVKNTKVSGSYESLSYRSPNGLSSSTSKFTDAEIRNLVKLFKRLAALSPQDNYINRATFEHYFPLGGILARRLFAAFDRNKNGVIDLQEFIDGMALCLQGSLEEKYQIAFEMFDLDGTNGVSADELYVVLKSVLMAATRVFQEDPLISRQGCNDMEVDQLAHCIVNDAFRQQAAALNQENKMTLKVFKSWIEKHPFVLDSIFGQTCLKDKTLQYGRLSEENLSCYTKKSSSVKKQTWVTSQKDSETSKKEPIDRSYSKADYLWSPVFPQMTSKPCKRCKLSVCLVLDSVYLYGGRGICTSLKDFWRYDIGENAWYPVQDRGSTRPSYLQEHTMVPYRENLVVFGGEFTSSNETPLWIFNTNTSTWTKPPVKQKGPNNRRGHSAVISGDSMYVFGGYVDLRGATRDLWKYEFTTNTWTREKSQSKVWPSPRYAHSAAVFEKSMVIFGGLEEMGCKNDLWLWNMAARKWTKLKGRNSPPPLFGHSAVKVGDGMLVFGGESTDGSVFNSLWRFNFDSLSWSTVQPKGMISPPPRSHHTLIAIPDFRFSSLRPSSSRSAPPSTPAYDRELSSVHEECEPIESTEEIEVKDKARIIQGASLGSLDSTALLSNTEEELTKVKLHATMFGSLDSIVTKLCLRETENMSMVNYNRTLSQESILSSVNKTGMREDMTTIRSNKTSIANSNRLLLPTMPGTGSRILSLRNQFKPMSAECLALYSKSRTSACCLANFPEVTNTGIINLMVLGGLSRRGIESSDRSIDMWWCCVNPEKQTSAIKKIEVQSPTTEYNPATTFDSSFAYENLSIEDAAVENENFDDSDELDGAKECVLMDLSDGDKTSVDMLITDTTTTGQSLTRISV